MFRERRRPAQEFLEKLNETMKELKDEMKKTRETAEKIYDLLSNQLTKK